MGAYVNDIALVSCLPGFSRCIFTRPFCKKHLPRAPVLSISRAPPPPHFEFEKNSIHILTEDFEK